MNALNSVLIEGELENNPVKYMDTGCLFPIVSVHCAKNPDGELVKEYNHIEIETWGDGDAPRGFFWQGTPHHIVQVCNRWRFHTRWWEPEKAVWREYWKVATGDGLLCLLFYDRLRAHWRLARIYD